MGEFPAQVAPEAEIRVCLKSCKSATKNGLFENRSAEYLDVFEQWKRRKGHFAAQSYGVCK
jgi:hypothetical protein